jgi:hypothetical protein
LSQVESPTIRMIDVQDALYAICETGKGRCWYCELKLPHAERAIDDGWDVQRVEGGSVASIILVCPACRRERLELGEEEFQRCLSLRTCNTTC